MSQVSFLTLGPEQKQSLNSSEEVLPHIAIFRLDRYTILELITSF